MVPMVPYGSVWFRTATPSMVPEGALSKMGTPWNHRGIKIIYKPYGSGRFSVSDNVTCSQATTEAHRLRVAKFIQRVPWCLPCWVGSGKSAQAWVGPSNYRHPVVGSGE